MSQPEKEISFEEALAGLERSVQALNQDSTTLDDAIAQYEQGMEYYKRCDSILREVRQKIEQFDKETGEVQEF